MAGVGQDQVPHGLVFGEGANAGAEEADSAAQGAAREANQAPWQIMAAVNSSCSCAGNTVSYQIVLRTMLETGSMEP